MKKVLLAAVAIMGISAGAALADYAAIAINNNGNTFYSYGYPSMDSARNAAIRKCRAALGGSCDKTVAEETWWHYAGGLCNGVPYVGASPRGPSAAEAMVYKKGAADGNYDCVIVINR